MKDDRLYLIHITECIDRIKKYTKGGKKKFLSDIKIQDAVLRNLHILSESTQRISRILKIKHPDVDWSAIWGFRNVVVHDYLGIDLKQIWNIISNDLPALHEKVKIILEQ